MSYRTYYSIDFSTVQGDEISPELFEQIKTKLEAIVNDTFDDCTLGDSLWYPDASWYDYDVDMKTISLCYPNVRFDVAGEGEESDDRWEDTWIAGKRHFRLTMIPPFDEAQLVDEGYQPKFGFLPNVKEDYITSVENII